MGRASFGGAGDYSQLFASLYLQAQGETERLANAAERRNEEAQAAVDQDNFDKWKNGELTDDELLAYIDTRVADTVGDPKQHAEWLRAQREYRQSISDDRAEGAFKDGGSIGDLIAHYEGRLVDVEKDTPAYRNLTGRLNDLKDQRASEDINDGLEQIMDGIERGKGSWSDVVRFYKDQLRKLRPSSPLRKDVEKALNQAQDRVHEMTVQAAFNRLQYRFDNGSITGRAYGKELRALASQFKASDPGRYYEILSAAAKIERGNPGLVGTGGRGGGGRGRSTKAINDTIDALQGTRNGIEAVLAAFEKGQASTVDPVSGRSIQLTNELVSALDDQWIANSKSLEAAYTTKGDKSAAFSTAEARSRFIVDHAQPHATMPREKALEEWLGTADRLFAAAETSDDPDQLGRVAASLAHQFSRFSKNLTTTGGNLIRRRGGRSEVRPIDPSDQANAEFAATVQSLNEYMKLAADPNTTPEDLQTAIDAVEQAMTVQPNTGSAMAVHSRLVAIANRTTQLGQKVNLASTNVAGIQAGTHMLVQTPTGSVIVPARPVVVEEPVVGPDGTVTLEQRQEMIPEYELGKNQDWTDLYVEVNGRVQKRKAIATEVESSLQVLVAGKDLKIGGMDVAKGQRISSEVLLKANPEEVASLVQSGALKRQAAFTYKVMTGKDGQAWSQDPETGQWFKGSLPFRHVPLDPFGLGTVLVDNEGKPKTDWKAFTFGVPAPFEGKNSGLMQDYLNKGLVDTKGMKFRDENGRVTEDARYNPLPLAYVGPEAVGKAIKSFIEDPVGHIADWWSGGDREDVRKALQQQYFDPSKVDARHRGLVQRYQFPTKTAPRAAGDSGPKDPFGGVAELIGGFAKGLGLNFSFGQQKAKPAQPAANFRIPEVAEAQRAALKTSAPRITAAPAKPGLDLSTVTEGINSTLAAAKRKPAPRPAPKTGAEKLRFTPPPAPSRTSNRPAGASRVV